MNANRIGGPTPESGKGIDQKTAGQPRRVEKVEKVKGVEEVENEQTRKKFQSFMDEDDEPNTETKPPSPYNPDFYTSSNSQTPVPSPQYSPPPDVNTAPASVEEEPPLPKSNAFWNAIDSPPDQPPPKTNYKETAASASGHEAGSNEGKEKKSDKRGAKIVAPLSGKIKEEKIADSHSQSEGQGKNQSPTHDGAVYGPRGKYRESQELEEKLGQVSIPKEEKFLIEGRGKNLDQQESEMAEKKPISPHQEKQSVSEGLRTSDKRKGGNIFSSFEPDTVSIQEKGGKDRQGGRDKDRNKKGSETIESPGFPPVPAQFIPPAQEAAFQATPYLNPQIVPLFFQMVGAIYMIASPGSGISKTEIQLTAPSFSKSKFFGSTITIEKYATAPDSLNIRLTGNNEAVTVFNQNIESLYAAFQQGNFNFRIGRIDVSYSREKPLFKRRDASKGKDDLGGEFEDRRGS